MITYTSVVLVLLLVQSLRASAFLGFESHLWMQPLCPMSRSTFDLHAGGRRRSLLGVESATVTIPATAAAAASIVVDVVAEP